MMFRFPHPNHIHAHSLKISIFEGIAAAMMINIVEYYLTPLALSLGATAEQIGILIALPGFFSVVALLFSVELVQKTGGRLKFLFGATFIQALVLVGVAMFAYPILPYRIEWLIAAVVLYRIFAQIIAVAWGSLMSDYLIPEERGSYFGFRSRVVGLANIGTLAFAGGLLFIGKQISQPFAFFLLFAVAALMRFVSSSFFRKMQDLPEHREAENRFGLRAFMARARTSNFVIYVWYTTAVTFAAQLAAPYFSVFMLRDLHLNYIQYSAIHLTAAVAALIAYPLWGQHADHVGNAKVLRLVSWLIPIPPLLWLVSTNFWYLFVVEFYSGFVWSAFHLCSVNYIFDAVTPGKRVRCLAYFNLFNGLAMVAGVSLGGFLTSRLPILFSHQLYTLFLLSGVLRLLCHFLLSKKFKEVRKKVRNVSSTTLFFSVVGVKPMSGINRPFVPFVPETKE
jgi:MFS family permease